MTTTKSKKKIVTETPEKTSAPASKGKYFYAHGKRKCAVAKVRLHKGSGEITINGKPAQEYLTIKQFMGVIKAPLTITGNNQKFDISVKVQGGGISSQAQAIRHGITKALVVADPFNRPSLKKVGFLTRDSRVKERKKYGLKRARKAPQFSKR